jgi:hypothetical protein
MSSSQVSPENIPEIQTRDLHTLTSIAIYWWHRPILTVYKGLQQGTDTKKQGSPGPCRGVATILLPNPALFLSSSSSGVYWNVTSSEISFHLSKLDYYHALWFLSSYPTFLYSIYQCLKVYHSLFLIIYPLPLPPNLPLLLSPLPPAQWWETHYLPCSQHRPAPTPSAQHTVF